MQMGGYQLSFSFEGFRREATQPAAEVSREPRLGFGLVVNTAPDEFLLVGRGLSMVAAPESDGPRFAGFGSIDEGRYEKGIWIPGRRINGDESNGGTRASLRGPAIGILKIRLYRYE
jgi:hypothetical protein